MSGRCWLNGAALPLAVARIDPGDRGFTLGDGVFETIAVRGGVAAHLGPHLHRLRTGAALLGIDCAWSDRQIEDAIAGLVPDAPPAMMAARLTLSRGPAGRGILPAQLGPGTLLITVAEVPAPAGRVHAIICRTTCRNEKSPLARIKSLNYLDNILARLEAREAGADDAVLLNTAGRVAEATTASILLVQGGMLFTPPVADGALPGIARAVLIAACSIRERSLSEQDLLTADAIILSNSLGLREIGRLQTRDYPPVPELLARLRGALEAAAGPTP